MRTLTVPYLSQHRNTRNPLGSCNVTCIAMLLHFYGATWVTPDYLYDWLLARNLSRHSGYDLSFAFNSLTTEATNRFSTTSNLTTLRQQIDAGYPGIIHGYFTTFGHIIVVCGYDATGFIVNDPYGEWFSSGYRTQLTGKNLHYSTGLIKRLCMPDGNLWLHKFSTHSPPCKGL